MKRSTGGWLGSNEANSELRTQDSESVMGTDDLSEY
jgi:hypothetical protein